MFRSSFGFYGSKLFSLTYLVLALPWGAMLLTVATEGIVVGLIQLRPSLANFDPLPSGALPSRLTFLGLCTLLGVGGVMLACFVLPRNHGAAVRRTAGLASSLSLMIMVGLTIWAYYDSGFLPSLQVQWDEAPHLTSSQVPDSSDRCVLCWCQAYEELGTASSSTVPSLSSGVWNTISSFALLITAGKPILWPRLRSVHRRHDPNLALPQPRMYRTGVASWSTLALGVGDLGRYSLLRDTPKRALLTVFPLFGPFTTFCGMVVSGALYRSRGASVVGLGASVEWMGVDYVLPVWIALSVVAIHQILAGYGVGAANAVVDLVPRWLNPRVGGAVFIVAALALSAFGPEVASVSTDMGPASGLADAVLSFTRWSSISGLLSGALFAVLIVDFFAIRRRKLPTDYLYKSSPLLHRCGVNGAAVLSLVLAYGTYVTIFQLQSRDNG